MGVAAEGRYKALVKRQLDDQQFTKIQIEAHFMPRLARKLVTPSPSTVATKSQVLRWMKANAEHYDFCSTKLAEASNAQFNLPEGAMDDPGHWVWECAFIACEE